MKKLFRMYQVAAPTLALVFAVMALCLGGAIASGKFVITSSAQIKNNVIKSADIHANGVTPSDIKTVTSADIANGEVKTADIGSGQVTPEDVTMPPPLQVEQAPGSIAPANVDQGFAPVDTAGAYSKADATSALQVSWSGTAEAGFSPCVFQIRVDGRPAAQGAGETYVPNSQATSISAVALFDGLPPGSHQIEIWARITGGGGATYPCTVGPGFAGIGQTFVIEEVVI